MLRSLARRAGVLAASATVVATSLLAPVAPAPAATAPAPKKMYVGVTVATVWTNPTKVRPVDRPALTNPAHPQQWLRDMTPDQSADLTTSNRTQTQALYGAPVLVLATQDGWSQVVVPGQPTPRDSRGYPGWVPSLQLTTNRTYAAAKAHYAFALVDEGIATGLYADRGLKHRQLTLSSNTRLPVVRRTTSAVEVLTPYGRHAWLPAKRTSVYRGDASIPRPTGRELVRTALTYLHQPYLWAGRSSFGYDCSGLTGSVYQLHGITIPRDSGPQAQDPRATPVSKADLRPGDLLFYSHSTSASGIYHVAMYAGHGKMVEAYDHLTPVRLTDVRLGENYWGAVRYLH